jgi:hypothetical protein
MSIVVYWLEHGVSQGTQAHHSSFADKELSSALKCCEELRKRGAGVSHVTMCSDLSDMVGKAGVDAIQGGKTPDGEDYDWSKEGRAGKFRAHDMHKKHLKADEQT